MLKKILITVLIVGVVFLTIGLILTGGNFEKFINAFSNDEDYQFVEKSGNEEVKELNIKIVSGNVIFHTYDSEGYKLNYYESEYDIKEVSFENNKLVVNNKIKAKFRLFNLSYLSKKISEFNVYIPQSFNGIANIETTSGNVTITDFNFAILNVNVTSGNINLSKILVDGDMTLRTMSGNTTVNDLKANSLYVKTTSGKIELNKMIITNNVTIESISGKVKINDGECVSLTVNGTSGDANLLGIKCDNIEVDLTSGNARLAINGNVDDYKIDAHVNSGKIYYQGQRISGSLYDSTGSKQVKVKCTSGNIYLDFNN